MSIGVLSDTSLHERVKKFIADNEGYRIALVTSGGTRVNLEKNAVRFIENFSMGGDSPIDLRHFLETDQYAVIFLHRDESLRPFVRRYWGKVFDHCRVTPEGQVEVAGLEGLAEAIAKNAKYVDVDRLMLVPFTTLQQYLHLVEVICSELNSCGTRVLVYLAAAVSDFYVDEEKMPTHKIQSRDVDGEINLSLKVVPKTLKRLVSDIVPNAYVVSFKLETDDSILVSKARKALEQYGHQVVIANLLQTRKDHVIFVYRDGTQQGVELTPEEKATGEDIENKIVKLLSAKHKEFIDDCGMRYTALHVS